MYISCNMRRNYAAPTRSQTTLHAWCHVQAHQRQKYRGINRIDTLTVTQRITPQSVMQLKHIPMTKNAMGAYLLQLIRTQH
jgi:hypothetical protein